MKYSACYKSNGLGSQRLLPAAIAVLLNSQPISTAVAQTQLSTRDWHKKAQFQLEDQKRLPDGLGAISQKLGKADATAEGTSGKTIFWDRESTSITASIILNSADPLGVAVIGIKKGDQIEITSASGLASFSEGQGKAVSSIISVIAKAGQVVAPEHKEAIEVAEQVAQQAFGQSNRDKQRDAFGMNEEGQFHRCQGGVLVCMPAAHGTYYRVPSIGCIKDVEKEETVRTAFGDQRRKVSTFPPRTDDLRPGNVKHGFFLVPHHVDPNHNKRIATEDGELYVLPWDTHKSEDFEDNQGSYRIVLRITRSDQL